MVGPGHDSPARAQGWGVRARAARLSARRSVRRSGCTCSAGPECAAACTELPPEIIATKLSGRRWRRLCSTVRPSTSGMSMSSKVMRGFSSVHIARPSVPLRASRSSSRPAKFRKMAVSSSRLAPASSTIRTSHWWMVPALRGASSSSLVALAAAAAMSWDRSSWSLFMSRAPDAGVPCGAIPPGPAAIGCCRAARRASRRLRCAVRWARPASSVAGSPAIRPGP